MVAGGGNAPPSIWLMRPFGSLDLPAIETILKNTRTRFVKWTDLLVDLLLLTTSALQYGGWCLPAQGIPTLVVYETTTCHPVVTIDLDSVSIHHHSLQHNRFWCKLFSITR